MNINMPGTSLEKRDKMDKDGNGSRGDFTSSPLNSILCQQRQNSISDLNLDLDSEPWTLALWLSLYFYGTVRKLGLDSLC